MSVVLPTTPKLDDATLKRELHAQARAAGFFAVGVARATVAPEHATRLREWLDAGLYGEMDYMERWAERRADAATVLDGAKSVIVFAAAYHPGSKAGVQEFRPAGVQEAPDEQGSGVDAFDTGNNLTQNSELSTQNSELSTQNSPSPRPLKIAKYALGEDYHYVLRERLAPIVEWLDSVRPGHVWRVCVDSAPLMERAFAVESGLGFFGKNSLVIVPGAGSFFLLAEVVTTAEIAPDEPITGTCGTCTRCIDACPTEAIVAPGTVDARRCISYLTIEKKSPLTTEESGAVASAGWTFGCDICQDVCPYNKHPEPVEIEEFAEGRVIRHTEPATTILELASNRQFERRFAKSPLLRPGKRRLSVAARLIAGEDDE